MLTDYDMKENWMFMESSVPPLALKLFHFNINEFEFLFKKGTKLNFGFSQIKKRSYHTIYAYAKKIGIYTTSK